MCFHITSACASGNHSCIRFQTSPHDMLIDLAWMTQLCTWFYFTTEVRFNHVKLLLGLLLIRLKQGLEPLEGKLFQPQQIKNPFYAILCDFGDFNKLPSGIFYLQFMRKAKKTCIIHHIHKTTVHAGGRSSLSR